MSYAAVANTLLIGAGVGRQLGSGDWADVTYFLTGQPTHRFSNMLFVPQSWTLPLELGFYLLAPFVIRMRTVLIFALCICLLLASGYGPRIHSFRIASDSLLPFQFHWFLFGVLAYRLYAGLRGTILESRILCWTVSAVAFGIVVFGSFWSGMPHTRILGIYMLAALCTPFLFTLTKSSSIDALIGELSYPVYLSHLAIARGLSSHKHELGILATDLWGATTLALTVAISLVYIFAVDRRVQAIRKRIAARAKTSGHTQEHVSPSPIWYTPKA